MSSWLRRAGRLVAGLGVRDSVWELPGVWRASARRRRGQWTAHFWPVRVKAKTQAQEDSEGWQRRA